jgi:hypothetical protein
MPVEEDQLEHGMAGYRSGCACGICRAANAERTRRGKQKRADGEGLDLIDAGPARANVQLLLGQKMPAFAIAKAASCDVQTVKGLVGRLSSREQTKRLDRDTSSRICNVDYDPLPQEWGANKVGAMRRLRACMRAGQSLAEIGSVIGVHERFLQDIVSGRKKFIDWSTHWRIAAYYKENCTRKGDSRAAKKRARDEKWPPAGAWGDNIDDFRSEPDPEEHWVA